MGHLENIKAQGTGRQINHPDPVSLKVVGPPETVGCGLATFQRRPEESSTTSTAASWRFLQDYSLRTREPLAQ